MKKTLIVEPVICMYMFAYSLYFPLGQQYVYRRIWEETVNSSFRDDDNVSHCELNQSDPIFLKQKEVQEKASLFAMKMDLSGAILNILVAFVLVANGDCCGRKISLILPLVGNLVSSIFLSAMSYYSLPLPLLYALAFSTGFFGGMATFLGGAFAFVVDLCENHKQKTIRIAVVDLIFGLVSGLGGLSSGFILKGIGFTWTFATISLIDMVNIFYVMCFLDDTVRISEGQQQSLMEGLKKTFSQVHALFKSSSFRKRTSIILLLCTFMAYLFTVFGGMSLFTLYELNDPLCWNEIYIGYGSAASTSVSLTSFLGIVVLSQRLRDIYLVFIGIFSYLGGILMAAFANTTLLMLLARVPSLLHFMPIPVLRSMLSKVVLPNEQGALFACIACLEVVTGTISLTAFNSIYAVTVAWFPGFSFLLSAALCIIPLSTLSWLMCATQHQQEYVALVHEEDPVGEETDS
ncbi:solute carrier family 46 member 3 [Eublepharis macularius]|uniref:Lysosomal proton-coupled steroid conjugate and bile acid symporter SLC46A3 n=1 Tax=Eublepharis macularius TaxID=481883 RepID=A0AA97J2H2_EUBMA|nr:solute carrier family 46 member 3 [Eublepharis macularius]